MRPGALVVVLLLLASGCTNKPEPAEPVETCVGGSGHVKAGTVHAFWERNNYSSGKTINDSPELDPVLGFCDDGVFTIQWANDEGSLWFELEFQFTHISPSESLRLNKSVAQPNEFVFRYEEQHAFKGQTVNTYAHAYRAKFFVTAWNATTDTLAGHFALDFIGCKSSSGQCAQSSLERTVLNGFFDGRATESARPARPSR